MTESRLARMKIMAVPLWNHMSGKGGKRAWLQQSNTSPARLLNYVPWGDLGRQKSYHAAPRSAATTKLNKLLETRVAITISIVWSIQIYGQDGRYRATSRRCQLRELIADLRHAGFSCSPWIAYSSETPCSGKISQKMTHVLYPAVQRLAQTALLRSSAFAR